MTVWTKLKEELDRAGRAAQVAIDEGRLRLELHRARQLADKAAQAIGYAVYRAKLEGQEVDGDTYARLSAALGAHEAEIARLDAELKRVRDARQAPNTEPTADSTAAN